MPSRARARRNDYEIDYKDPTWILLGLLEAKLDELADILEDVHKDLEKYSTEVLNNRHREQILDLDDMITRLAQLEDMLGKALLLSDRFASCSNFPVSSTRLGQSYL